MLADKRRAAARTLSGGQRQILAMAIALMNAPDLLLLDEPTAGLSPRAAEELFGTIVALNRTGVAILMVEQNALEALAVSARAYVLVQGRPSARARPPTWRPIRRSRDLFLGGTAAPMLAGQRGNGGRRMKTIRIGRRAALAGRRCRAVGKPGRAARARRSDQARHPDAAHRRGRALRAGDGQGRGRRGRGGQQGGRRARPQGRAGERGRPDQPGSRRCAPRAS